MKLIAQVKLKPTQEQHFALGQTLNLANHACNSISSYAWNNRPMCFVQVHWSCRSHPGGEYLLPSNHQLANRSG